jgi:hypothetical protein
MAVTQSIGGVRVMLLPSPSCKRCSRTMQEVANIPPRGAEPGLRAFICSNCGAADSVLVHSGSPVRLQKGRYEAEGDVCAKIGDSNDFSMQLATLRETLWQRWQ